MTEKFTRKISRPEEEIRMPRQEYRKNLSDELKTIDKEDRKGYLESVKKTRKYWEARATKINENRDFVFNEDSTIFSVKNWVVYHGTDVPQISKFEFAENSTIGDNAVYFTDEGGHAHGYGKYKEEKASELGNVTGAYMYEIGLSNVTLMDWENNESVKKLRQKYLEFILGVEKEFLDLLENDESYAKFCEKYGCKLRRLTFEIFIKNFVRLLEDEHVEIHGGNIKFIAARGGFLFEKFVKDAGCDGVITGEGGEGEDDKYGYTRMGGRSVVLFNKDKIKITQTQEIAD